MDGTTTASSSLAPTRPTRRPRRPVRPRVLDRPSAASDGAPGGRPWEEANKPATTPRRGLQADVPWDLWQALGRLSGLERVRKCRRVTTGLGGTVDVVRHGDRVGFSGLQTCGSVHACPLCAARVLAERTEDLKRAVDAHHEAGGRCLLITTTLPHDRSSALARTLDAVLGGWGAAMSSGTVRRRRTALGWLGFCRRFEVTDGVNGWHPHVHALAFIGGELGEDDPAAIDALRDAVATAHANHVERAGHERPSAEHGTTVKLLNLEQARGAAAGYLTKGTVAERPATSFAAALEVTASTSKRAGEGSRTPFEILGALAEHGDEVDHARWLEYEAATAGRRLVTWTPGLRKRLCGSEDERTDEEIAAEADQAAVVITPIDVDEYRRLIEAPGLPGAFVAAMTSLAVFERETRTEIGMADEVDRWLKRHGVRDG